MDNIIMNGVVDTTFDASWSIWSRSIICPFNARNQFDRFAFNYV